MRVYLAGPMRGVAEFNFPAFFAAADKLRADGHEVFNPAQRDVEMYGASVALDNPTGDLTLAEKQHSFDLRDALKADVAWIFDKAEAIALLPGWRDSDGASAEYFLARSLGLKVIPL